MMMKLNANSTSTQERWKVTVYVYDLDEYMNFMNLNCGLKQL